jgi:hypothetical protein
MLFRSWSPALSVLALGLCPVVRAGAEAQPIQVTSADQRWTAGGPGGVPGFTRHIQPLLGKLGCSNRACHGSFQGKGGFRLSLFGSDPQLDVDNLVESGRVDVKDPEASLALLKPTKQVSHKGGLRFEKDGWQHRMFRAWIAAGAAYAPGKEATVQRLEITPGQAILADKGAKAKVRVVATFSDNSREDVTALTQFATNDDGVAAVTDQGEITAGRPGDTALVATFGGSVETIPVLVPRPGADGKIVFPASNRIDELVAAKLQQLGLVPAELTTDEEFLRRASLDIAGTLPTPQEVLDFLADRSADKRARKIDELLTRPAHALWWSTRLGDLTGLNAPAFLGSTDFGPQVGLLWQQWLERKVRDNVGYDRIVAGIVLGTSRKPEETYDAYVLRQSSYVRKNAPADFTAEDQMPHYWFRGNLGSPEDKALGFAYTFLGVRLECAQCHRHPFDRWTQQDFQQFTHLFERIRNGVAPDAMPAYLKLKEELGVAQMKNAAERRVTYRRLAEQGKPAPWPEVYVGAPMKKKDKAELHTQGKLLGGAVVDLTEVADPRVPLMEWLRRPGNPYFAPAFVNRVWAHYFGKGLVDPPDDHNRANPASHRELLDYLSAAFVERGYDMKWLHREIATSRTYQLSCRTNETNRDDERNLSHALIRRLPAEVALDALRQATAGTKALAAFPANLKERKIGQGPPYEYRRPEDYPLAVFGKPLRKVNCDCERETDASLLQSVFLRNDQEVFALLDRSDGWLNEVDARANAEALVREAYLRTLSRLPDAAELARCRLHLSTVKDPVEGLRDLLWALLNTKEFITNH